MASLGDLDRSKWETGKFGDEPEDPWTPVIEFPLTHRETGEAYTFTAQSKTSLAAAKDFLGLSRRLPESFLPIVRLHVGLFKGKFGSVKKPVLSMIGKSPIETDITKNCPGTMSQGSEIYSLKLSSSIHADAGVHFESAPAFDKIRHSNLEMCLVPLGVEGRQLLNLRCLTPGWGNMDTRSNLSPSVTTAELICVRGFCKRPSACGLGKQGYRN